MRGVPVSGHCFNGNDYVGRIFSSIFSVIGKNLYNKNFLLCLIIMLIFFLEIMLNFFLAFFGKTLKIMKQWF